MPVTPSSSRSPANSAPLSKLDPPLTDEESYNNVLPSIDFSVEVVDNVVARASWSKTIARAS